MKLNIGSYKDYREGWVNLDLYADADVKADCFQVLPFRNNSFDALRLSHVFEHTDQPIEFLRELWRVSRPGALIEIIVPHFNASCAFVEPPRLYGCRAFQDEFLNAGCDWGGRKKNFTLVKLVWELGTLQGPLGKIIRGILSWQPYLIEMFFTFPGQIRATLKVLK